MTAGKNFLDQLVRNNLVTYNSVREIATGQRGDLHKWLLTWL